MSPVASTSARYSRIARQYHQNDTRPLRGLRLPKAKAKSRPQPAPKEPQVNYGPLPRQWSNVHSLAGMGFWKTASRDPRGIRLFLMRGADVVLCTAVFSDTPEARPVFNRLICDYLASMTLYSLPAAFYDEAQSPARNIAASREREA